MAQRRWVCTVCGHVHVGDAPPDECPVCGVGADMFQQEGQEEAESLESAGGQVEAKLPSEEDDYLAEWERPRDALDPKYERLVELAKTGKSRVSAMGTRKNLVGWDEILFRGAQLSRSPLEESEAVDLKTTLGATAQKPLVLDLPFYVSHMSFGALSREAKIALARGASEVNTACGSGEGGMLADERAAATRYIYELGTADFSHKLEAIEAADAIEIKIGQAAKPGMGGHLPASKVTDEIAKVRGVESGHDCISPGRHTGIDSAEDLARRVAELQKMTDGKPIGVKISAGHLEEDLAIIVDSGADFVTIDTRGGGTGAALDIVKDNVCIPAVFAVHRARDFLDEHESKMTLCVTGGFRDAADIAKALAMGADAVALATASMVAIGCQQYRICNTGMCPVGIATQDEKLRARFDIDKSTARFVRFAQAMAEEIRILCRINGHGRVHDLNISDLLTLSHEIARYTEVEHA